jgi:hypothetical protein
VFQCIHDYWYSYIPFIFFSLLLKHVSALHDHLQVSFAISCCKYYFFLFREVQIRIREELRLNKKFWKQLSLAFLWWHRPRLKWLLQQFCIVMGMCLLYQWLKMIRGYTDRSTDSLLILYRPHRKWHSHCHRNVYTKPLASSERRGYTCRHTGIYEIW